MNRFTAVLVGMIGASAVAAPALSQYVGSGTDTFASYAAAPGYGSRNLEFNSGTPDSLVAVTTSAGTNVINTTRAIVNFTYSDAVFDGVTTPTILAYMTFTNLVSNVNNGALTPTNELFSGVIKFTPVNAGEFGGTGTNLLTVTLTNVGFSNTAGNKGLMGDTSNPTDGGYDPGAIAFSSDILTFNNENGTQRQASITFTGASTINGGKTALASSTGNFASDPIPTVPESATWAMMLIGFGAVGVALRSGRTRRNALFA